MVLSRYSCLLRSSATLAFQLRDFLDTLVFKSCTAHLTLLLYKIFLHYSMFVFSRLVLGL